MISHVIRLARTLRVMALIQFQLGTRTSVKGSFAARRKISNLPS